MSQTFRLQNISAIAISECMFKCKRPYYCIYVLSVIFKIIDTENIGLRNHESIIA